MAFPNPTTNYPKPEQIYDRLCDSIPTWEYVGSGGGTTGQFGIGQSTMSEYVDIEDTRLVPFVAAVLGSAKKNGKKIARQVPASHAQVNYLYASKIHSLDGIGPIGKRDAKYGPTAAYKLYRLGITYETPPYRIVDDEMLGDNPEWERYVIPEVTSAAEFIQRRQGSYSFPADALGPGSPPTPIPDVGGVVQRLTKQRLSMNWIQVPDDGLFTKGGFDYGGRAKNIEDGLGRVNLNDWHDYPAGTLLLESWHPEATTQPIVDGTQFVWAVNRSWNVRLNFIYFDPEPGESFKRGHNLVPSPQNNKWWRAYVTGKDDTEQYWRYQTYDFDKLFEMNEETP